MSRGDSCAIITFNYDVALDVALTSVIGGLDYSLPPGSSHTRLMKVFKLHGSINWASCRRCHAIVPVDLLPTPGYDPYSTVPVTVPLGLADRIKSTRHCGEPVETVAVIVPPTWNKTDYAEGLKFVWESAAQRLSRAENFIVFGYSLPETDSFFRYLFALGSVGDSLINRFWVFDPDSSRLETRFRQLLGTATASKFRYRQEKSSKAVQSIVNELHYVAS